MGRVPLHWDPLFVFPFFSLWYTGCNCAKGTITITIIGQWSHDG